MSQDETVRDCPSDELAGTRLVDRKRRGHRGHGQQLAEILPAFDRVEDVPRRTQQKVARLTKDFERARQVLDTR